MAHAVLLSRRGDAARADIRVAEDSDPVKRAVIAVVFAILFLLVRCSLLREFFVFIRGRAITRGSVRYGWSALDDVRQHADHVPLAWLASRGAIASIVGAIVGRFSCFRAAKMGSLAIFLLPSRRDCDDCDSIGGIFSSCLKIRKSRRC